MQVDPRNRDRIKAGIAVAAIHALIGWALLIGLGVRFVPDVTQAVEVFDVLPEPPPPPPVAEPARPKARLEKAREKNPEGAASPKNLRDTPTPVVVPPPLIPMPVVTQVVVAPVAAEGNRASAGASDVPGPGTGSGGQGTGFGSGEHGSGTGGGGGGGTGTPPRWIRGAIYNSDYPDSAVEARAMGTVRLSFVVAPDGRVSHCTVHRSSGHRSLDEVTCRLIKKRFRYRPATDDEGRPIADTIRGQHVWELGPEPPPIDVEPTIPD